MLVSHSHPAALFHAPYPQCGKALSAVHTDLVTNAKVRRNQSTAAIFRN